MIEFCSMELRHIDEISEIEKQCFSKPWNRNMLIEELVNVLAHYNVILWNHCVAGYAGMWYILDEAHITNIAISSKYQGIGLGKSLLGYMIKTAKLDEIKRMTLEVRKGNKVAIALYNKLGFIDCGIRKGYYEDTGDDAIIMWRDL